MRQEGKRQSWTFLLVASPAVLLSGEASIHVSFSSCRKIEEADLSCSDARGTPTYTNKFLCSALLTGFLQTAGLSG